MSTKVKTRKVLVAGAGAPMGLSFYFIFHFISFYFMYIGIAR